MFKCFSIVSVMWCRVFWTFCFSHSCHIFKALLELIQLLCHRLFADADHPETMEQLRAALEKVDRQLETKLGEIACTDLENPTPPASQEGKGQQGLPRQPLRKIEREPIRVFSHDLTVQNRQFLGGDSGKDADLVPALLATTDSKKGGGEGEGARFRRKTNAKQSPVRSGMNTPGER